MRRIARATGSVSLFAVNVPESKVDFYLLDKAIESGLLVDAQIRDKPDSYIATQPPMQVTGTMGSAKNRGTPVSDEAVPYTPRASNVPGNDQRFAAATPATLTATLKAISSDATVQALIDNGRLKVVAKQAELPRHAAIPPGQRVAGWVDPQTGVVYLIADNITQAEVDGLLDHEIGVHQTQLMLKQPKPLALRFAHGLLRLIGAKGLLGEPAFNDVLAQLERMRAAGNVRVVQAFADAKAAGGKLNQSPRLLAEEALAYLTQNHPQLPLIQRLMAMIRAALYRAGFKMNLTEADLHALAKSAVRVAAAERAQPATTRLDTALQRAAQAPQDVEAQRQYDAVVAKYKGTPEWMKAPNGQPTKLTERQWVQVRTPNFKRWFGNFAFDENESVPVIDVATDALEGVDLKSADSVREWLLSSSDFTTPATNAHSGLLVEFSRKNLKASLKRRGVEHRQAYSVLRRLIETARLTDYEESNRPGLAGQDIYYAALRLPNGNVIGVRIKADVRHNRRTSYKDHRIDDVVTQIQVTPAAFDGSLAGIVNIRSTGHPQSGVTVRLGALVGADKPVSSKTVDENGEPMVAHHGTSGEFFEFDRNKLGENTENAGNKLGFFFTDRDYVADSYSLWFESRTGKPAKVVSAFVSMANPYYAEAGSLDRLAPNSPDKEEELARLKEIKDSGEYDGIVFSTKHNGTEYVAFSPTQIKSAIGNTGAFSPTNRDIRYARALGESNPTLTADEVLAMIDAGQEVTNEEFAFLQAYLAGASKKLGVDAPSFNAWFGASKIVDRAGKPLKMYHATTANFTVFDANRAGGNTTHPTAGLGFFFTNNRSHAAAKYGDNVMETYLTIEKPYRLTDADLRRMDGPEAAKAFRQQLEAKGYDGVILDELGSTKYVAAFYPDQIKLTENETYTKGEQDVRFAIAQPAPGTPPQVDPPPMTRITWASAKGAKGCPLIT